MFYQLFYNLQFYINVSTILYQVEFLLFIIKLEF